RLAATAIGKEGIVGDVDVARIGPHLGDLAKDGEAAEPGIEDENGGSHGGCWYEKNGRSAMSRAAGASRPDRGRRLLLAVRARIAARGGRCPCVKRSSTLAENCQNLIQLMRVATESKRVRTLPSGRAAVMGHAKEHRAAVRRHRKQRGEAFQDQRL